MNARVREPEVLISEVGPRDGLQSVKATMPTAQKLRWIDALVASGLREIEVGSFVPARLLPQMADTAEVVRHALTHPGVKIEAGISTAFGCSIQGEVKEDDVVWVASQCIAAGADEGPVRQHGHGQSGAGAAPVQQGARRHR